MVKTKDILQDLNIEQDGLINSIMFQKLKYFDHIKHHSGWERKAMEVKFLEEKVEVNQREAAPQDIRDTMCMKIH